MLESHAISSNLYVMHHKWPKVSFLSKLNVKRQLVFSWKGSDSMMRGKFQMNSIQYGELPKQ